MSAQHDDRSNNKEKSVGRIIGGIGLVVVAFILFSLFNKLETGSMDSFRVHWLVAILYTLLGAKWTSLIVLVFGFVMLFLGLLPYVQDQDA